MRIEDVPEGSPGVVEGNEDLESTWRQIGMLNRLDGHAKEAREFLACIVEDVIGEIEWFWFHARNFSLLKRFKSD